MRQWQTTEAAAWESSLDCCASVGVLQGKTYPLLTTIKAEMRTKKPVCCFWLSMLWAVAESWVNVPHFYNLAHYVVLMVSQPLRRFMVAIQLEYGSKMLHNLCLCRANWPDSTNRVISTRYKYKLGSFNKMHLQLKNWEEVRVAQPTSHRQTPERRRFTSPRKLLLFLTCPLYYPMDSTELWEAEFLSQDVSSASSLMQ